MAKQIPLFMQTCMEPEPGAKDGWYPVNDTRHQHHPCHIYTWKIEICSLQKYVFFPSIKVIHSSDSVSITVKVATSQLLFHLGEEVPSPPIFATSVLVVLIWYTEWLSWWRTTEGRSLTRAVLTFSFHLPEKEMLKNGNQQRNPDLAWSDLRLAVVQHLRHMGIQAKTCSESRRMSLVPREWIRWKFRI